MGYVGLLLCALCLAFAQERTEVFTADGFNFPFVVDEDIRLENGISTLYVTFRQRCVYSFVVSTDLEEAATISIAKITSFEKTFSQDYLWTTYGTATAEKGVSETIIDLDEAPLCASTWRLTVENTKAVTWTAVSILADPEPEFVASKKRVAIDCADPDTYPSECAAASDGALCLTGLTCGCKIDKDCFGNTDFPYCTPAGICDRCTELEPNPTTSNLDHLFCRTRYPGFATQPTTMDTLGNERVAPLNYYREVCVRTPVANSGACQRCNQAPQLPFNLGSSAINNGASGTVHCNKVGPPSGAALNPICIDIAYMSFAAGVPTTTPPASYDPNRRGACGPCTIDKECSAALPLTPVCVKSGTQQGSCAKCTANAECSLATTGGNNCQADGSCRSCTSNADCGALDGGETPNQGTCDTTSGICQPLFQCTDNASCSGRGGNNCQADKSCKTCLTNADCGTLDGGETPGQQVCNVASGQCGPCSTNANCVGTSGNNCQATGLCLTCTANTNCGTLDGGETSGQAICNVPTGICEDACTTNTACASKPGKNCQKTGVCLSCTSDATCGALDGGETPNQSLCETNLGICTTPFSCTDNPSCTTQVGLGANCQKDGTCISCTSNTCGTLDGGEIGNQPNCLSTSRLCTGPCTTNSGCLNTQGNNCMKSGACVTCTTNSDCNNDGGEVPDQSVCNVATGICEAPCTTNGECAAVAGKNCNKDGTCVSCVTPADCGSTDGGEIQDQPACNAGTGICGPCGSNDECPEETPNCGSDGGCYHCNAPGNRCDSMDGPPGGPNDNQPHCDTITGICVEYCTADEHCPDDCAPFCHLNRGCCVQCLENDNCPGENWRLDQAEYTVCSSNSFTCVKGCSVDDDCEEDDKPACSPTTGECVECLYDTHCDDFTSICASSQTCVECVTDSQCAEGQSCSELACTSNPDAASGVVVSLFLVLSSALVALF